MHRYQARSGVALLSAAVAMAAGCTLIGGTDGLFIDEGNAAGGAGASSGTGGVTSSGSSSSSSGAAGASGAGGAPCVADDCPGTDTECAYRACVDGACALVNGDTGTGCSDNSGKYCDGAGSCVPCIDNDQHPCDNSLTCQSFTCVGVSCTNSAQDGSESDVDCGGSCGACPNGKKCNAAGDCQSHYCAPGTPENHCNACSEQTQCGNANPSWYCDLGSGSCADKKPLLADCANDYECKSEKCVWFITWHCGT